MKCRVILSKMNAVYKNQFDKEITHLVVETGKKALIRSHFECFLDLCSDFPQTKNN